MDLTARPPEGVSVEEFGNTLKITCKPKNNLPNQMFSFLVIDSLFILAILSKIGIIHIELLNKFLSFPPWNSLFFLLFLFVSWSLLCALLVIAGTYRRVIEINDTTVSISKPLPILPPTIISPAEIDALNYECRSMGFKSINSLELLLKNNTKIPVLGMMFPEEEQVKFIQSAMENKLGLSKQ